MDVPLIRSILYLSNRQRSGLATAYSILDMVEAGSVSNNMNTCTHARHKNRRL